MSGACSIYRRNSFQSLVEKTDGKPKRRWEDNIKIYFEELRLKGVGWINLAQDRV
jgi:hypothetical protein